LIQIQQAGRQHSFFLSGFFVGLLILVRGNAFLLIPFILMGFISSNVGERILLKIGYFSVGLLLTILPSLIHNKGVSGQWVLTTSQGGTNFYMGNNSAATGTYMPLIAQRGIPPYEAEDAERIAEYETGHSLKPGEVSSFWFKKGARFFLHDPWNWVKLFIVKSRLYFDGFELLDVEDFYLARKFVPVLRLFFMNYGIIVPLAFLGILFNPQWIRKTKFLIIYLWGYGLSVILFYVVGRYRLPSVPGMILLASVTTVWVYDVLRKKSIRSILNVGCVGFVLFMTFNFNRSNVQNKQLSTSLTNTATLYQGLGKEQEALGLIKEALKLNPGNSFSYHVLGNIFYQLKFDDQAIRAYNQAFILNFTDADALYYIGLIHERQGRKPQAERAWRKVLEAH
jgi:4-amino-4-deoxy-L-arabinose transferase-like glycosyltransferase